MLKDGEKGVIIQRVRETYAIVPHIPCGVVTPEILRKIADVAEKYQAKALKITRAQRIAIVGIKEENIDAIWKDLDVKQGYGVGLCVHYVNACPGTTFCKRGQQDSLGLGLKLDEKYYGFELPGKTKIGVSGCANSCAESQVRDIGLIGKPKGWTVMVGGCVGARPRLGDLLIEGLSDEEALNMVDKIINKYKELATKPRQRLARMINKIGFEEFKKVVLAQSL